MRSRMMGLTGMRMTRMGLEAPRTTSRSSPLIHVRYLRGQGVRWLELLRALSRLIKRISVSLNTSPPDPHLDSNHPKRQANNHEAPRNPAYRMENSGSTRMDITRMTLDRIRSYSVIGCC